MPHEQLFVNSPNIGDHDLFHEYVDLIFRKKWLTNQGEMVQTLETRLAEFLGVKHCIALCNATIALEIAAKALGFHGEVIVPSLTFIATAHSLQWQEINPIFADVDRDTYNLCPDQVARHITPRTTGIVATHVYGRPCDIDGLQRVADEHGLKLMFDAAHAFGCSYKGRMIGSHGNCEVFSFHATKFFNTFEGGAIATNDDELARRIRLMKNFGFAGEDDVVYIGTNGKMNEISAAMGLVNLASLDKFLSVNQRNYHAYKNGIEDIEGLSAISFDNSELCNWQYIAVEVSPEFALSRDELIERLKANNVHARRYFWPGCHRMEPYRSLQPNAHLMLPVTEMIAKRIVIMPTGTAVSVPNINEIIGLLKL